MNLIEAKTAIADYCEFEIADGNGGVSNRSYSTIRGCDFALNLLSRNGGNKKVGFYYYTNKNLGNGEFVYGPWLHSKLREYSNRNNNCFQFAFEDTSNRRSSTTEGHIADFYFDLDWSRWDSLPNEEKKKVKNLFEYLRSFEGEIGSIRDKEDEVHQFNNENKDEVNVYIARRKGVQSGRIANSQTETADMINQIEKLLEANHQIILTGAPGTGKTFLAKKIACSLVGCETWEEAVKVGLVEFCQFHPSYSYADFVEGLRPLSQGGTIGFERKDGVFKEFCVRALKNLQESEKSQDILDKETRAREMIDEFLNDSLDNERELKTSNSSKFFIERVENEKIYIKIPENEKTFSLTLPYGEILKIVSESINLLKVGDIREVFGRVNHRQQDSYVFSICKAIKQNVQNRANSNQESTSTSEAIGKKNFVFIIDEINRGDVSKIFGELFYAIDPGYRGVDGRVMTQYDNLIEEGDPYYGGFYVPKNVYIIGTMNDIDRSVESMDFAIRRRFTWYEVTADARKDMLNDIQDDDLRKKAMARMQNINNLIADDSDMELGSAYQIGPAYFLKLKDMSVDKKEKFDTLWKLHIEPLLKEYLRGQTDIPRKIQKLKKEYDNDNSQRQQAVARNEAAQQTSDDEGAAAVDHAANG